MRTQDETRRAGLLFASYLDHLALEVKCSMLAAVHQMQQDHQRGLAQQRLAQRQDAVHEALRRRRGA